MKKFLFINNNFPNDFSEICDYEDFRPSDEKIHDSKFTFNQFAHKRLSKIFNERQYDLIILPYSLDEENYLTFTGINVGLHIRLTPSLKHSNIPILFIGPESIDEILKLAPYPHLFSTSGIFYTKKRNLDDLKKQATWILTNKPKLSSSDYKNFIKKITLQPPSFYDNRHSIANEWALLLLDSISGHNILKDKPELQEIKSNLYVKWLMIKNGIQLPDKNNNEEKFLIRNTKGKRILLIDDEWNKGWLELFKSFLGHKVDGTIVDYIHIEKTSTEDEINKKIEVKLQEEWDLFLLDIRLTDKDHQLDSNEFERYSGFKMAKTIKKQSLGNQIVLLSASNKFNIYEFGRKELGINEVIIKPDLNSNLKFKNLELIIKKPIADCLSKNYLKKFDNNIQLIRKNFKSSHSSGNDLQDLRLYEFEQTLSNSLDLFFTLISRPTKNKNDMYQFPFLVLYILFENYCKETFVAENNSKKEIFQVFTNDINGKPSQAVVIWKKDEKIEGNHFLKIEISKGKYSFQTESSHETIGAVRKLEKMNSTKLTTHKIKLTSLLQRASILIFKHNGDDNLIAEFLELNYLRNNLVGHDTGNIKKVKNKFERNIELKDIWNMFEILKMCLLNKNTIELKKKI